MLIEEDIKMSVESNKALMWRLIEEVWNKGNYDVADEIFTPDSFSPSAPQLPPGPEATKILARMFREAMPDYHMLIDFMVADEDKVSARFIQSGTHTGAELMGMKPSGRKATWTEIGTLLVKNGKVVTSWYEVDMLAMAQQLSTMSPREIMDKYYEFANAGKWDDWCDLFADNMVMDEQLAGHIEGLATLRPMMAGMGQAYKKFQNVPKHIFADGNEGAVVSHISALAAKYPDKPIEAEVMNYFRFENGKIAYMANFHDSKPFQPFLDQISGK